MNEPQIILFIGDPYRCERALAKREKAIFAEDEGRGRYTLHADELDPSGFGIDLRSTPLFSGRRHFVVRHAERAEADLAAVITEEIPDDTFVSLIATELNQKSSLLKACKERGAVVTLPSPRGRATAQAALNILSELGLNAEKDALSELLNLTGGGLLDIAHEAEKLRSLVRTGTLTREVVERLVFPNAEHTVYPFYDRLGERDFPAALAGLRELDEDPTWILSGAIRHLTRLAMIRLLLDRKTPAKRIGEFVGIPVWLASKLIGQAKCHTIDQVASSLKLAIGLDLQVKSGELSAADALLKLVFAVTSPPQPGRG